ncbi:heme ABC transporter substrate-binding protein IsdE [Anaerosporobacter sp.]|uniref:heme ABC transporter substrate-binding protein IsdE n=1 Tax=Anaerosporobacter sp. TaxID=1872529 RepID=UPI00286F7DAD|nr:heme ABC transporter substrate-binding protein IsdE [Anaerosporobacter sp.]
MRLKKLVTIGAIVAMSVLAAGCGKKESNNQDVVTNASKVVEETTEKEEMVEVAETKEKDSEVKESSKPVTEERVVASSVAVVQILDALGVPMIGVPTSSYELPESVADAARIGSPMSPDMEVVASLEPTVVVSVDSLSEDLKTQFETLNIDSEFVNLSSYVGLKESINSLGERFGVEEKSNELIASFEEREGNIKAAIEGKEAPSVLIIFGAGSSFMVASEDSYVGDLVKIAGAENIITDAPSGFSPIDMEYLAEKNPDYILFMAHANPEESLEAFKQEFETNQAWQNFDAVKNGNVVALETEYFGMSANLYAVDAMEKLVDILYEK